jgi:hypothetical protein
VYSFEVWGSIGDGSGDVTWSGAADNLYVKATGDVGPIGIDGDLYVDAGWTVGNLSGRDVSARAGKSIGTVDASDDVGGLTAGTSIGAVTAADDVGEVRAGTSVGTVGAGGDVGTVSAGRSTASVQAGGHILTVSAGWDVGGTVTAGTFIGGYENPANDWYVWQYATFGGGVSAGRNVVGSVRAGASLSAVRAGGEIQAEVRAGGDIWVVTAGGGFDPAAGPGSGTGSGSGSGAAQLTGRIAGPVVAGRDVHFVSSTGDVVGAVTAGRSVTAVNAGGSVLGPVTAALDVGRRGAADSEPTWRPAYYDPYWYGWSGAAPLGAGVQARDGAVAGAVTATAGDITAVSAGGTVGGAVTAGRDIGSVTGRTGVSGAVAGERDVGSVQAGMGSGSGEPADVSGKVQAGRDIGSVSATGDVTGRVQAGHGIGGVTAGGDITSTITAGAAVGRTDDADPRIARYHPYLSDYGNPYWGAGVRAGGDFTGEVTAGTDVSRVEAGGSLGGSVHADRDVGFVHGTDGVSAEITAARDIGSVYAGAYAPGYYGGWQEVTGAPPADFAGGVGAGGGIATMQATGSVLGSLTAADSIGYLGPLVPDPGEEEAPPAERHWGVGVWAGLDIDSVIDAGGDVAAVHAGRNIAGSITADRDVCDLNAPWDITADVDAGRDIGDIAAEFGRIGGTIHATRQIGAVWARDEISGSITAGAGDLGVDSGASVTASVTAAGGKARVGAAGDVSGPVTGRDSAWVDSEGAVTGDVVATAGDARVEAGGDVTAAVRGGTSVWIGAAGAVRSAVASSGGDVRVDAGGEVTGTVTGALSVWVISWGAVKGSVTSLGGDAWVDAAGSVAGGVTGFGSVRVYSHSTVTGSVTSVAGDVWVTAADTVTGAVTAAVSAWVESEGSVSGPVTALEGDAWVNARNDVAADVWGMTAASAAAGGRVTGIVVSTQGPALVDAAGDVTGAVSGYWNARVTSGGSVSGAVTSPAGDVTVDAGGDVTAPVTAVTFAQVSAGGGVTGPVTATGGGVWLSAGGDVVGDVHGTDRVRVEGDGLVSGSIDSSAGPVSIRAGAFGGTASAATDLTLRAAEDVYGTLTAGGRLSVSSYADVIGVLTSTGGDAEVEAAGTVAGSITASGDVTVYAGDVIADVESETGSVAIFAEGAFDGTAHAPAGAALVNSAGDVTGVIDAAGEIWVWAGGSVASGSLPDRADGLFVWSAGAAVPDPLPPAPAKIEYFDLTAAFAAAHVPAPLPTGAEDTMPVADAPRTIALFIPVGEKDTWRRMVSGVRFVEDPRLFAQGYVRVVIPLSSRNDLIHNHVVRTLASVYQLQGEDLRAALTALYGGHLSPQLVRPSNGDMHDGSRVLTLVSGTTDPQKKGVTVGIALYGLPAGGMTQEQIDAEIARRRPFIDQVRAQLRTMRQAREYPNNGRGPAPAYATHRPPTYEELRLETKLRRMHDPVHWNITSSGDVVPRGPLTGSLPINMLALEADQARTRQSFRGSSGYAYFLRVLTQIRNEYEGLGRRGVQLQQIGRDYEQYLAGYQSGERLYTRMLATPSLRAEVLPQLQQFMLAQRAAYEATLTGLPPAEQQRRRDSVPWLYGDPGNPNDPAFRHYRPTVAWTESGTAYFAFVSTPTLRNLVLEQALAAQSRVIGNLTDGYFVQVADVIYVPGTEDEIAVWYAKYGTTPPESIVNKNLVPTSERPLISDSTPLVVIASGGVAAGLAYGQGASLLGAARAGGADAAINLGFIAVSEAVTSLTNDPAQGFVAGAAAVIGAIGARKAVVSAAFRREIVYFLKSETGTWFVGANARTLNNVLVTMGVVNHANHPVWRDLAVLDATPVLYRSLQDTEAAILGVFRKHWSDFDARLANMDAIMRDRVLRDIRILRDRICEYQESLVARLKADTGARDGEVAKHLPGSPPTAGQLTDANALDALDVSRVAAGRRVSVEVGGQGAGGCDIVVREATPEIIPITTGRHAGLPTAEGLGRTGEVLLRREVKSIVTDNVNALGNNLEDAVDQLWKWSRNDPAGTQLEAYIQVRSDKGWTAQKVTDGVNDFVNTVRGRLAVNPADANSLLLRDQITRTNRLRVVDERGTVLFDGPLPSVTRPTP